jgi:ATP-dependent RNA helicase DeaD
MTSFSDFSLQPATLAALTKMGVIVPTPIQAEAIPALLAGNDVVGRSATGSGKTLAYSIPLVERLSKERVPQALILVPTRELAVQVNAVIGNLASGRRLATALLVGGRAYAPQMSALRYGSQIIVGTPGRVQDHIERGTLVLEKLRICVLDEADQMLDSGFAPAIEQILTTTPATRQMALFSATMPEWVKKIQEKFLNNPVTIDVTPATDAQSTIEQTAYQVPRDQKMAALCTLLRSANGESTLIFGKTKFGVEKLGNQLVKLGYTVGTLHGNKSQRARDEVLNAFRRGHVQTLLATNVAARGLDIQDIYQVINYELPESSELFTHRIGRTGRMGKQGKAITLLSPADVGKWRRMARDLGQKVVLERLDIDEEAMTPPPPAPIVEAPIARVEEPQQRRKRGAEERDYSFQEPRQQRRRAGAEERNSFSAAPKRRRWTEPEPVSRDERSYSPAAPKRRRWTEPEPDHKKASSSNRPRKERKSSPFDWEAGRSHRATSRTSRGSSNRTDRPARVERTTGRRKTAAFR